MLLLHFLLPFPIDNLIEKYGQNLINSQKIVINGNIMAIAVIVNTQHLIYREDIFNELKIDVPKDYEEIFLAAEKINKTNFVFLNKCRIYPTMNKYPISYF